MAAFVVTNELKQEIKKTNRHSKANLNSEKKRERNIERKDEERGKGGFSLNASYEMGGIRVDCVDSKKHSEPTDSSQRRFPF